MNTETGANRNTNSQTSRKLTMNDLIDECDKSDGYYNQSNKYNIPKNQQEFGEKKRIKP